MKNNNFVVKSPNYPFAIGWCITNECNLRCKHCNMRSGKKLQNELSFDECKRIIDELSENKVQKIMFSGGEPLTRKDFFEITDYAFNKGITISLTTNSLLLTDEIIEKYLYKFEIIRVSLDGPNSILHEFLRNKKGSYEITIRNIEKMVNFGINVGIVTCVSKKNINDLQKMAILLEKLSIKKWFLPLLSPSGRGENIIDEALSPLEVRKFLIDINEISKNVSYEINLDTPYCVLLDDDQKSNNNSACPAAITELVILANGDVTPCCQLPLSAGNCLRDGIKYIWNQSILFNNFRNRALIKGNCSKCKYLMQCGGCRANAYTKYGDYLEGDDMCWKR